MYKELYQNLVFFNINSCFIFYNNVDHSHCVAWTVDWEEFKKKRWYRN